MAEDGIEVHVVGFEQLSSDLVKLAGKIEKGSGPELERAAHDVANVVRARVPRLTGALAGSVAVTGGEHPGSAQVRMGDGLEYGGWIEFGGTRGRPYVPMGRYVYPAAREREPQIEAAAAKAAEREIGGFSWSTPRA